ncbi:F-box protein SKIP23-like [Pyrus communis]|uniref:F-box protein SKIP23-like n=1 Tax=Pyrus communis TaxID=23211 RepID=UPI0035C24326
MIEDSKSKSKKVMSTTLEDTPMPSDLGWAWLPNLLLDSILEKLIPISDHIRFSAVCKHWKSVALHHKQQRVKSRHNQLPMLMIPTKHNSDERRGLYGVTQRKPYNFELYVPYKKRCCGSSHGWLACADDNLAITLLNPFTGRTIRLPPVTEVPPQAETFKCDYYINKVVLSADPCLFPNDYEVLVLYDHAGHKIAHFKSGDDGWSHIVIRTVIGFCDLIYYEGRFLVVSYDGLVFSIDTSSGSTAKPDIILVVKHAPQGGATLVESSSGELLLIRKLDVFDFWFGKMTQSFKVYRVECACGDRPEQVEEIESIGNDALFLDYTASMRVSALDFPGCQPNCIYFVADDWTGHLNEEPQGPLHMGAFNLENRRTETHQYCIDRPKANVPASIWILPTIV